MVNQRSSSGRPLAASAWLEAHHRAKLRERRIFAQRLSDLDPARIVDLGCATGLWLNELNRILPNSCEFIGLDSDQDALVEASDRAESWSRPVMFEQIEIGSERARIPESDLTLLFNVSPYIADLDGLLESLSESTTQLAIRQYDGSLLRFGPMASRDRSTIDESLRAAVEASDEFRHYDLDRLYSAIEGTSFASKLIEFETFERWSPFPQEFLDYFNATMDWTSEHLSEVAAERLRDWLQPRREDPLLPAYFMETDLTAVLS